MKLAEDVAQLPASMQESLQISTGSNILGRPWLPLAPGLSCSALVGRPWDKVFKGNISEIDSGRSDLWAPPRGGVISYSVNSQPCVFVEAPSLGSPWCPAFPCCSGIIRHIREIIRRESKLHKEILKEVITALAAISPNWKQSRSPSTREKNA